jgi:APA family basic amino acid/polyamine antiporter
LRQGTVRPNTIHQSVNPVNPSFPLKGAEPREPTLARRLGPFDATMIVMGGIIGAGIFVNPSNVAREVHTRGLVLGAWVIGGAIALIGAFVYAELAALRPRVGGQYAYLRDAYHPMVAFVYGWTLLLVVQTGGMAGAAIICGRYFQELTGVPVPEQVIAGGVLGLLTLVNCLGVRAGSNVQSALMLTKLAAIAMLIGVGFIVAHPAAPVAAPATGSGGAGGLAAAMIPVLFAYGGWQTASFVSGEMRDPKRDLPRGLLIGVIGVIILYLTVTYVCLRVLGVDGLARTRTPASEVMRRALGDRGAQLIALGIAVSTVGFLSQSVLTAPRVYYAMARDGVFFSAVGKLSARTRAPVVAIVLQGVWAAIIALTGKYDQILNYVEAIDVLFFGLTGASLIVFRRREQREGGVPSQRVRVPGHPFTTALFVLACWAVAVTTVVHQPRSAGIGVIILLAGVVVFQFWRKRAVVPSPT